MIKYQKFNPDIKYNCVIRSLSKITNKDCGKVKEEIIELSTKMNHNDYTDIEVFEKYNKEGKSWEVLTLLNNYRSKVNLHDYFNKVFVPLFADGYDEIPVDYSKISNEDCIFTYSSDAKTDGDEVSKIILDLISQGHSYSDFMVITSSKDKISFISSEFAKSR